MGTTALQLIITADSRYSQRRLAAQHLGYHHRASFAEGSARPAASCVLMLFREDIALLASASGASGTVHCLRATIFPLSLSDRSGTTATIIFLLRVNSIASSNDTTGAPRTKGFDYYYGQIGQGEAHDYYPTYVWENEEKVHLPTNANASRYIVFGFA